MEVDMVCVSTTNVKKDCVRVYLKIGDKILIKEIPINTWEHTKFFKTQ